MTKRRSKKEIAYDEKISPLMAQIIAVCKENDIAHLSSFELGNGSNGKPTLCTTVDVAKEKADNRFVVAVRSFLHGVGL